MEKRPVIKLHLSFFDRLTETAGWILVILLWSFTIYVWFKLPDMIPTHFNAAGKADGHGSKETLLVLPVIGSFVFALITLLNKYPHIFNYAVKITNDNAERQYTLATRMMRYLKLCILLIFLSITILTFLISTGKASGLGQWFLPATLLLIFLPIIYMLIGSFKMK